MKKFKLDESDHLVDLRNFCMIKVDEFLGKHNVNVNKDIFDFEFGEYSDRDEEYVKIVFQEKYEDEIPPKVKDYILDELYQKICHYEEDDFKYITQTINDTEYFWIEFITDKEII